jgi:hypothetical protein
MISRADCMNTILRRIPNFEERWQAHLSYWDGEEPGLCIDVTEFSDYVADLINQDRLEALPGIFDLIEQLMVEGDDEVRTAVATCFLENLLNVSSAGKLEPAKFTHLLGPESRAYCRAWDEFTGVHTNGV